VIKDIAFFVDLAALDRGAGAEYVVDRGAERLVYADVGVAERSDDADFLGPEPQPGPQEQAPPEPAQKSGLRGALEFDTSSQMLDDYGKLATDTWQRFLALPATEKVGVVGILLALVSVLLPWWTTVAPTGLADDHLGLEGIGLFSALLAVGGLGLVWYRLSTEPAAGRVLVLAQVAVTGLGILCGVGSFISSLTLKAPTLNPHHIRPGPGIGVVFALAAWTVALIGAVVALKDAGGARGARQRAQPQ